MVLADVEAVVDDEVMIDIVATVDEVASDVAFGFIVGEASAAPSKTAAARTASARASFPLPAMAVNREVRKNKRLRAEQVLKEQGHEPIKEEKEWRCRRSHCPHNCGDLGKWAKLGQACSQVFGRRKQAPVRVHRGPRGAIDDGEANPPVQWVAGMPAPTGIPNHYWHPQWHLGESCLPAQLPRGGDRG